jgi:hypothetical protein
MKENEISGAMGDAAGEVSQALDGPGAMVYEEALHEELRSRGLPWHNRNRCPLLKNNKPSAPNHHAASLRGAAPLC